MVEAPRPLEVALSVVSIETDMGASSHRRKWTAGWGGKTRGPNAEMKSLRQEHSVDHMDNAVALGHVGNRNDRLVALGVDDLDLAAVLDYRQGLALNGRQSGLAAAGLHLGYE